MERRCHRQSRFYLACRHQSRKKPKPPSTLVQACSAEDTPKCAILNFRKEPRKPMTRITRLALYVLLVFVLASQVVQKSSSAPSESRPYLAVPGAGPKSAIWSARQPHFPHL